MSGLVEYTSDDEERAGESVKENGNSKGAPRSQIAAHDQAASASASTAAVQDVSHQPVLGPQLGPSPSAITAPAADGSSSANVSRPTSPYTAQRRLIHNLTLPPIPNVSMPPSPAGSPRPSTTAKIEQFLRLKAQGIHFNEKLAASPALRNPGLLGSLRDFAGIDEDAQYASTLPDDLALGNERFDEWAFAENIGQEIAKREKKRKEAKGVEFISSRGR